MIPPIRRWPDNRRPAIEVEDPPAYARDYHDLAAMADVMISTRRDRFPELVSLGKLEQADADREIELFAEIAAHWHWVVTGEGQPASRLTILDRCAALDTSIRTIASKAAQRSGFDEELAHQAHCVIAMRWHADPKREHLRVVGWRHHHGQPLSSPQPEKAHADR